MYLAVEPNGRLVQMKGLPLIAKRNPERLLTVPDVPGAHMRVWLAEQTPKAYVPKPNLIGTCMLVALKLERQPYKGEILFTGWTAGQVAEIKPWAAAALNDIHTAIRIALTGQASGMGAEFDEQAISTARMAVEGALQ